MQCDRACLDDSLGYERVNHDAMSLHLIEEALTVYRSGPVIAPANAPAALKEACALLDYELMRLPLEQVQWPHEPEPGIARSA